MFCIKCGKELKDTAIFCSQCGTPVNKKNTNNNAGDKAVETSNKGVAIDDQIVQSTSKEKAEQVDQSDIKENNSRTVKEKIKNTGGTGNKEKKRFVFIFVSAAAVVLIVLIAVAVSKGNRERVAKSGNAGIESQVDPSIMRNYGIADAEMTERDDITSLYNKETTSAKKPERSNTDSKETISAKISEGTNDDSHEATSNKNPEATSTNSQEAEVEKSEFIIKDSDKRVISKEELNDLSQEELRIARNEIYARHGRKFTDAAMQAYFNSCSWYKGTIEANDFTDLMLSDIENANKNAIMEREAELENR